MKVNGLDIKEFFDVKQWNVEMAHGEVENGSSWEDGCIVPILIPGHFKMKKIKISVMAKGDDRESIWNKTGKFIAEFRNPAVLVLDGFSHKFKVVLTNASQVESSMRRFHKATLELQGYEYGEAEETKILFSTASDAVKLDNPGTIESPFTIKVTQERQYESNVTVSEYFKEGETEHTVPIVVFHFTGDVEGILFNGETGELLYKRVSDAGYNAAPLNLCEVACIPCIPPDGITLKATSSINTSTEVTVQYTPMFL